MAVETASAETCNLMHPLSLALFNPNDIVVLTGACLIKANPDILRIILNDFLLFNFIQDLKKR